MDEIAETAPSQGRKPFLVKIIRVLTQIFFFILFGNLVYIAGFNFFEGIAQFNGFPFPVLQSHITPGTTINGVYDVFMESLSHGILPFLALGVLLIFGILIGRATCGWMCPFGFALDVIYWIPVKKRFPGIQINTQLSKVKFFILFLTFFIAITYGLVRLGGGEPLPIGPFKDNPFSPISPNTTFQALIPITISGGVDLSAGFWSVFTANPLFLFDIILMVIIFILSAYIGRAWCRYFCPLGGLLGLFNPYSIIGVKRNVTKCLGKKCRACESACPMGVPLLRQTWEKVTDSNCILCFKCYSACDEGAIGLNYFKTKQTKNE